MDWVWIVIMALRQASPEPADRWAVQLAGLDRQRAAAFEQAEVDGLDEVYVGSSRARAEDAATIRAYAGRGGRVVGAELRVLACRVVRADPSRATLEVVDVLAPARVVWRDGSSTELPRDQPSRRRVVLERTPDGWRLSGAVELSPRP